MKIVINTDYGMVFEETERLRKDAKFIEDVESGRFVDHVDDRWGNAEVLKVVEIPDDATDAVIFDYDGCECILYVCDGKIYHTPISDEAIRCLKNL